ncbi:M56 family metallopeptidase [Desulforamulus aeronauticus]|uniref:Signal transducer regulating beta-lactamase production, contains metallopeptidase domain n=1 Tax=Desulforamulus aeronauticus DSM 10349 TaxID=1121421 RepID=A0A1M6VFG6_9FIRM|nr:M56 family metallopeptidase [Desulforamulus aeronauticus]SHK80085.1 Signal transducer regulating beta-lactamase production, contains metallopeptidase domain [Desulforamulus aeronauticus DSM 10349]
MEDFLSALFLKVLNMSITSSYVILFVMIARLFLKKAPKIFSYTLWAVVLFRLLCPFSFSSAFSFLKAVTPSSGKMDYISSDVGMMVQPQIETGIDKVNSIVNSSLPAATPYASANPMQIIMFILSVIWVLGVLILVIYSVSSYFLLKQKVSTAMLLQDNIFECENIATPFVLGIINPKIYLPIGLSQTEKSFILRHEQTHIRRLDYIIKPFAFLVLCVHWFNPLVWISFVLMSRDMEMSCDEQVIKELGTEIKKDYSASLLFLAVNRGMINGSPLSFGETGVKGRIKNVLNYQRPTLWVIVAGVIVVAAMVIGLASNPNAAASDNDAWDRVSYFTPDAKQAMEIYIKALRESDYLTQLSLAHAEPFDPKGQEIWDTIKINHVKVIKEDVRENKACYWLELDIKDGGNSAFEKGVFPRWLWLVKGEQGWYVEGLMTSGPPIANWWLSGNKQEKEISIDDLTERSIITSDRYKNTEYPLIAELPKEDIYLYGLKPTGVVLRYGDKIQFFNWEYTTPRFILPVLHKYDLDNDGEDEIICVLNVGSGTGLSLYELHVLKLSGTSGYVDYMFSDYLEQMKTMLSTAYHKKENSIVVKTNNNSYIYDIPIEYQKLTYKNVAYGNIVFFDISNGLKIKIPLGVLFDEFVSPQFFEDTIFFEGDIVFKNGKFQITSPQITNK